VGQKPFPESRKKGGIWFFHAKGIGVPRRLFQRHSGILASLTDLAKKPFLPPGPLQSRYRPTARFYRQERFPKRIAIAFIDNYLRDGTFLLAHDKRYGSAAGW
jgi:hypothetical protein